MPEKCASCSGPVPAECIEFNDQVFCDKCFKCKQCRKALEEEVFDEVENGKTVFYCSEACLKKKTASSAPPSTTIRPSAGAANTLPASDPASSCDGCKKVFAPKEEFILLKGKDGSATTLRFHDNCFVCSECKKPIGNAPYGVSHGKPIHADGPCAHGAITSKTQGSNEFEEDLECEKCGDRIRGRKKEYQTSDGKMHRFHLTCLRCSKCSLGITDSLYVINDQPVCHRCHK